MYRRIIAVILTVVLILSLAACSGSQTADKTRDVIDDPEGAQVSAKTIDTEKLLSTPLKQETQQISSKAEINPSDSKSSINKSGLSKSVKASGYTLTIHTDNEYSIKSPEFLYTKKLFEKKYPSKTVKIDLESSSKPIGVDYDKELNKKIMAGNKSFDIFLTGSPIYYIQNKTYHDLSSYPSLISALKKMQDGVEKNCTYKNAIFGVPFEIAVYSWQLNESLATKLGITAPKGLWTWEQFYDLARKARKDSDGDGKADTYLVQPGGSGIILCNMADQYAQLHLDMFSKKASYNTTKFIGMLKLLKKLYSEDLLRERRAGEKYVADDKNALLWQRRENCYDGLGKNRNMVYLPVIQGNKWYPINLEYFVMNKNSQNKELAAEFMQLHLSNYSKRLSPSIEQYYKENDLADKSVFKENGGSPTKKNMDVFDNMLNCGKVTIQNRDIALAVFDGMFNFINSEKSAEETAKKIDQKVKAILNRK